jgi:hypothetical protein
MGNEANCVVRTNGKKVQGKALLETSEIIFRSEPLRLKIPFSEIKSIKAVDGELRVESADSAVIFEIGPYAEKWAHKILNPKSRIEKLGVKPGSKVTVIGKLEAEFEEELREASPDFARGAIARDTEWIFMIADTQKGLAQATNIAKVMKGRVALWIVYPKGRKDLSENDVLATGRKAGLKDVKVVGFSPTHTALKFVVPVGER